MSKSSTAPVFESMAVDYVTRHLTAALMEAKESLAHSKGLPAAKYGKTFGLTRGAVDALIDAINELQAVNE